MASKMMHSLLLVGFGASSTFAYPTYLLQASNCARSLTPGTQIMGNSAASDSSQSMSVTDSNRQSASSVEAGGSVSVSFSVSGNQHVIETSLGTFSSGTRGCGNQRTTSSSTTLSVPASAAGQTITIRAGFAARHGPIGLASEYTLTVTAASTGCEMGAECGGQVANFCGSACPSQCGVDAGFCSEQCVNGFFCPTGSSWDGASTSCVLTGECGSSTVCEMGAECGGQVANFCGSACPRQCGVDAGFCTSQCVNGFFCPTGSSWDGASTSCVLTGECGTTVAPPPPPLVVVPACPADLDGDNTVNVNDVLQLMSAFGRTSADDLTGDGVIDVSDVLEMLTAFGMTCPGGTELPPGIAIGRPFMVEALAATAGLLEAASDWAL